MAFSSVCFCFPLLLCTFLCLFLFRKSAAAIYIYPHQHKELGFSLSLLYVRATLCVCVCVAQREPIPENDSFAVEKGTSLLGKLCPVLPGYCFTHTGNYTIVWGIDSPATALARCTLGWSDLDLFSIFENGHYAADEVHTFMIPSPKNRRIWPRAYSACAAKFSLSKITGTLKNVYFLKIFKHLPFTSKNNRQKENLKLYIYILFLKL